MERRRREGERGARGGGPEQGRGGAGTVLGEGGLASPGSRVSGVCPRATASPAGRLRVRS